MLQMRVTHFGIDIWLLMLDIKRDDKQARVDPVEGGWSG